MAQLDILPAGSPATPRPASITSKHAAAPLGAVVAVWRRTWLLPAGRRLRVAPDCDRDYGARRTRVPGSAPIRARRAPRTDLAG